MAYVHYFIWIKNWQTIVEGWIYNPQLEFCFEPWSGEYKISENKFGLRNHFVVMKSKQLVILIRE